MRILLGSPDVTTDVLLPATVAAISVGAAVMASAALARRLTRSGKVWVGQGAGRTRVSPYMLIGGLVGAAGALFFLAAGLYDSERLRDPVQFYCWVGIVGASALGALALLPFAQHTWEWDSTGVRWRGAFRSVEMPWPDLVHLGKRFDGVGLGREMLLGATPGASASPRAHSARLSQGTRLCTLGARQRQQASQGEIVCTRASTSGSPGSTGSSCPRARCAFPSAIRVGSTATAGST